MISKAGVSLLSSPAARLDLWTTAVTTLWTATVLTATVAPGVGYIPGPSLDITGHHFYTHLSPYLGNHATPPPRGNRT